MGRWFYNWFVVGVIMKKNIQIELPDKERQPVECWTRVMGYLRPVSQFNTGKTSEYAERKWFTESRAFKNKI